MNIRNYEPKDYEELSRLWIQWGIPNSRQSWVSNDGIIVENNGSIVCMGFLFQMGTTKMYWMEGIISDRKISSELRKSGLDLLVDSLTISAKLQGAEIIMTSTPRSTLKTLFNSKGFNTAPEKYEHLGRLI